MVKDSGMEGSKPTYTTTKVITRPQPNLPNFMVNFLRNTKEMYLKDEHKMNLKAYSVLPRQYYMNV